MSERWLRHLTDLKLSTEWIHCSRMKKLYKTSVNVGVGENVYICQNRFCNLPMKTKQRANQIATIFCSSFAPTNLCFLLELHATLHWIVNRKVASCGKMEARRPRMGLKQRLPRCFEWRRLVRTIFMGRYFTATFAGRKPHGSDELGNLCMPYESTMLFSVDLRSSFE